MPDISTYNGIDMGDIASINGQDIAAGAYNPVTGAGTYTETVPSTGMVHYGYDRAAVDASAIYTGAFIGDGSTSQTVLNFSSDVDGVVQAFTVSQMAKSWTKIDCNKYIWAGIEGGRLWMASWNAAYVHQSSGQSTLTQVTSLTGATDTGWTDVSVGSDFVLAINGGKLFVVGENGDGQLGTGNTTDVSTLTQIGSDTDWFAVSGGDDHSAAIKGASGDRSLLTTGENNDGKCGSGDTSGDDTSWTERVAADSGEDWTFVEAGYTHTIAILAGKLYVTGDGGQERFGNNSTSDVTSFTQEGKIDSGGTFGTNWTSGTTNYYATFLVNSSGEVWYAGAGYGGTGSGNTTMAQAGYYVKTSGNASAGTLGSLGGSDNFTSIKCARHYAFDSYKQLGGVNNGVLYLWGQQGGGNATPFILSSPSGNVTQGIAQNASNTCGEFGFWHGTNATSGLFAYFT